MKIDATSTATTSATAGTGGVLAGSKDEFLKLFMAQLQHQDPLSPKSGADMVAQLAQFSSVEQAQQTNQHLIELASAQAATSNASLSNLVGRECNVSAGNFQLDAGGAVPALQLSSTSPLTAAVAVITDGDGKELRRIPVPGGASSTQLTWDGLDSTGNPLPAGSYHLAIDPGKTTGTITSQWRGRVDAVELSADGAQLRMGGLLLSPGDVRTIGPIAATATPVTSATPSSTTRTSR